MLKDLHSREHRLIHPESRSLEHGDGGMYCTLFTDQPFVYHSAFDTLSFSPTLALIACKIFIFVD